MQRRRLELLTVPLGIGSAQLFSPFSSCLSFFLPFFPPPSFPQLPNRIGDVEVEDGQR